MRITLDALHEKYPSTVDCKTVEDAVNSIRAKAFPWPIGNKRSMVADRLAVSISQNGIPATKRARLDAAVFQNREHVGPGRLFTYTRRANGRSVMKGDTEQLEAFRKDLSYVYRESLRVAQNGKAPAPKPASKPVPPKPEPKTRVKSGSLRERLAAYKHWSSVTVRRLCERHNVGGHTLDSWGMRPTLDGLRLLAAGVPAEAVRDAVTMHFPEAVRRELGVTPFDFVSYGIAKYLRQAAAARVPLMMSGPKGTGKSYHAKELAGSLKLDFGMVSMTAGTSPSAFYGRPKVGGDGGVVESHFVECYRNGGVFLFDEMDAADPNILLIVNAALANGEFHNSQTGETIKRHPDFIPVAAMNTMALGGDREYVGRDRLDAATLDRFAAGRIRVELDRELESKLAEQIIAQVKS